MSTDYIDFLDTTLLQEKRPVTYKLLARKLGIHVNTAKQALWAYSQERSNIRLVYCISGQLLADGKAPCQTFQLVKGNDLEKAKKGFRQITGLHVHSILPYEPKDLSVLVTANKDIPYLTLEDRLKCGVLRRAKPVVAKEKITAAMTTSTTKPVSSAQSKSTSTKPAAAKPTQPKPVSASSSKASSSAKEKTATSSRKRKDTSSLDTDEKSSKRKPVANQPVQKKAEATNPKPKLKAEDIFSDDEEDTKMEDNALKTKSNEQPKEEEEEEEEEEAAVEEPVTEVPKKESEGETTAPSSVPGKIRRKVLKKKHYTNERGFLVTEDVWEWETVDADESTSTAKPSGTTSDTKKQTSEKKPASTGTKKTGKKGTGEQKSLLNFWGKK